MDEEQRRRNKGLVIGGLFIAYDVLGGLWDYVRDSNSMDFFAMGYALKGAFLHAVLFSLAGLAVIAWYRLKPLG